MTEFSITIQKRDKEYFIPKPPKPATYVKIDGKSFPFLAVPGRLGWQVDMDEIRNIKGWRTSDPSSLVKMIDLPFVETSAEVRQEVESSIVTQQMSRSVDSASLSFPENDKGFTPYPYQVAGVAFIQRAWDRGVGAICVDEVGLGKTAQALLATSLNIESGRVLIVCPANVRYNWRKEVETWWNYKGSPVVVSTMWSKSGYRVDYGAIDVIDGRRPPRKDAKVVICSYSMFSAGDLTAQMITGIEWTAAILDESHYLKNRTSSRSRLTVEIKAKYRLALTATPVEKVSDMFRVCSWLDPETYPEYGTYSQSFPRGKAGVIRLNDILRGSVMYGRKKQDVAKDLPPLIWDVRVLDTGIKSHPALDAHAEAIAQKLKEKMPEWERLVEIDKDSARSIIAKEYTKIISSMGRVSGIPAQDIQKMRVEAAWGKMDYVCEQAQIIIASGQRLLIGHHHKEIGAEITRRLTREFPDKVEQINGSVKPMEREAIRERFDDEETLCIVASITAASTGINLQSASNIIMAEVDWSGANNYQFAGRIHRIGQENTCYVMVPVAKGSIEQHVLTVQSRKQELIQIIQEL